MGSRGSDCCCGCLLCSLFQCLFSLLLSVVFFLGVIILILWLIFRPNAVKVAVENASLTQFDLTNTTTTTTTNPVLIYNLTLDISIRNPNKRIGIYYDSIEAQAIYDGFRFGLVNLPTFYQDHKNTTVLNPAFNGQQQVSLMGPTVTTTFNREKGEGTFYIEVKLYAKTRLKFWFVKSKKYSPSVDCTVKLPVPSSGGSSQAFSWTKCDVNFF